MRKIAVVLLIAGIMLQPLALPAQQRQSKGDQDLPLRTGKAWFRPPGTYAPMKVGAADLQNSDRINQLLRGGNIMLSLSDAIALALENNLDIAIQRDNPKIADLDILRTKAGALARGVRASVTSTSTSSGGGAGSQGGTGTAAGGVGQGSGGLTTSTLGVGPAIGNFDPAVTANLGISHGASPVTDIFTSQILGIAASQVNVGFANFNYSQAFHSGTGVSFAFNNNRRTNLLNSINPQVSSNYSLQLTQHLLQGFGLAPNTRNIRIARNNREVSDLVFKQQIVVTVTQIQNMYWDLVSAVEDVKVKESAVTVAEKLHNDNKRQVEVGTLAPIEVVRAEAEVARTRQDLIVSQTTLQQQETSIKNAILRNLSDPAIFTARVVPTDRITVPPVEPVVPIQELMGTALSSRPELAQSRIDLNNREISFKAVRNAMLPTVDAVGTWGGVGTAGLPTTFVRPGSTGPNQIPPQLSGGLGTALSQAFTGDFPTYSVSLQVNIPIRNRSAQADAAQAQFENRQARLRLEQLENGVRIEVQNAMIGLQQNRARLDAASSQRALQEQTLDAEQKKFQLGASTIYNVIQAQRDLASAQSVGVTALNNYVKSRVEFDRATGQTISKNGISMEEAYQGQVTKPPQVLPASRQN